MAGTAPTGFQFAKTLDAGRSIAAFGYAASQLSQPLHLAKDCRTKVDGRTNDANCYAIASPGRQRRQKAIKPVENETADPNEDDRVPVPSTAKQANEHNWGGWERLDRVWMQQDQGGGSRQTTNDRPRACRD